MNSLFPKTIQARLILSHMLVSLISIALLSIYAGQVLFNSVLTQVEQENKDLAFAAANDLDQLLYEYLNGQYTLDGIRYSLARIFVRSPNIRYTIYLSDGQAILDSSNEIPPAVSKSDMPEVWQVINGGAGLTDYFQGRSSDQAVYLAVGINHEDSLLGVLHVQVSLVDALGFARGTLGLFIGIALVLALTMSLLGFFLARSIADPIKKLTRTADSLAQGDLSARVLPPKTPFELHKLAEAFNTMAGQLQEHVIDLRSFVANASHELRTPLTSIKLRVEALREGALDDPGVSSKFLQEVESEVDRLSKMVNDLLDLSRIEAGLEASKRSKFELSMIANEVYETFHVRAERSGIKLNAFIDSNLPAIEGNEDQIRRMLYNLVDNALKYTTHGGTVDISLRRSDHPGTLYLSVSDTGFGIEAAQLPHIFERFYRVEATRPRFGPAHGSGLGLPIAKSIVDAHGGRIGVTSQIGKGSTFWVELPSVQEKVQ